MVHIRWFLALPIIGTCLLWNTTGFAAILSGALHDDVDSLDLTAVGSVDWVVFEAEGLPKLAATEFKKGGAGIARKIQLTGELKKTEATPWTGVSWMWTDGTETTSHIHHHGSDGRRGQRLWLGKSASVAFEFAAPPTGQLRQAYLLFRCDGPSRIFARQDGNQRPLATPSGKTVGLVVARYDGERPLTLEIVNTQQRDLVLRGFAAALSGSVDHGDRWPHVPTQQEMARRQAEQLGAIDYLKVATEFADCMIRYGRDRYGTEHSPLFAVLLSRETEPKIGPQPYFDRPSPYQTDSMKTPFRKHNYNRCLNYPAGLGSEGPHKVTFFGCDVYEDRALYEMLIDLSRITDDPKYRKASEDALRWWFTNTMGPAGLYPWGEHMGWDFENECPTYFEGPSKHLYAACYHEIKDRVPFLDFLAKLPADRPGELTYLERYTLGVWDAHYWDQEKAVYCRHGDYLGGDDRHGSYAGFPAHQGAHLRLWVAAYLNSKNADVREKVEQILHKVLDVQIARTRRFGFVPFTFDPDYQRKDPGKTAPSQSIRLAHHAAELAVKVKDSMPEIAAKLKQLAELHLGSEAFQDPAANASAGPKPSAEVTDLSEERTPERHAQEIVRRIEWYRTFDDPQYLKAAEQQARLAYVRFCDEKCPLPKYYADGPVRTVGGEPFPDFYFRGASLMHAFALLGEALAE